MARDKKPKLRQVAVLPYRRRTCENGETGLEIMLVTSRETRRWVIPKGNIDLGMTPHGAALSEAFEEAGVRGRSRDAVIGRYRYHKYRGAKHWEVAEVDVFAMEVTQEFDEWQEMHERKRKWFRQAKAATRVNEKELQQLIRGFSCDA